MSKYDVSFQNINEVYAEVSAQEEELDFKKLEALLKDKSKPRTDAEDQLEYNALMQYISYEQTSKQITNVTMATKFDTATYSDLSEVRTAKNKFDSLVADNPALPSDLKEKILGSAIGMFETNNLQLKLWEQFFSLKTNPIILDKADSLYKGKLYTPGRTKAMNQKDFAEEFISYLYQNEFTRLENDSYRGMAVFTGTVNTIIGNRFYYDELEANTLLESGNYGNLYSVIAYMAEREMLFDGLDMTSPKVTNSLSYQLALDETLVSKDSDEYAATLQENYVDAEAVFRSQNGHLLFEGSYTYSNRLTKLKKKYPFLAEKFSLVADLTADVEKNRTNLYLSNLQQDGYVDVYTENLEALKEHPESEISDFFKLFDRYAVLQSGIKSFGKYVMTSIIDQAHLDKVVGPILTDVNKHLAMIKAGKQTSYFPLDDFSNVFYQDGLGNANKFKSYLFKKKRGYNYEATEYFENQVRLKDNEPMSLNEDLVKLINPVDKTIARNSSKVILFKTESPFKPNYGKTSLHNKYMSYFNDFHPESVDGEYAENDIVWVIGDRVNKFAYVSDNNKDAFKDYLRKQFETNYLPELMNALADGIETVNVGANSGIESYVRDFLKAEGLVEHKIFDNDGVYYQYSQQDEVLVNGIYSTKGGENNVLDRLPILGFVNIPVTFAIGKTNYSNVLRYIAAKKSTFASEDQKAKLKETVGTKADDLTNEEWVKVINNIKLDEAQDKLFNQSKTLEAIITKAVDTNPSYSKALITSGKSLLLYGKGLSKFERDFSNALMKVRAVKNGYVTNDVKTFDDNENPFTKPC
jgi:hypothetical protein